MSTFLLIIVLVLGVALAITYFLKRRVEKTMAAAQKQAAEAQKERDVEILRARGDIEAAVANAQTAYEQKVSELNAESERIRAHYEAEARKIADEANARGRIRTVKRVCRTQRCRRGSAEGPRGGASRSNCVATGSEE